MTQIMDPTVSYLYKPNSATLDATGSALLTFGPDTGQFWLPTLVHVSNESGVPQRCQLHSGGPANFTSFTTFKDYTPLGNNDTSTILSGTVLARGGNIVVAFSGGIPGDQVFAEVYGLSSLFPPTIGIIPEIPGARFAGGTFNPQSNHNQLLNTVGNTTSVTVLSSAIPSDAYGFVSVLFQPTTNNARLTLDWYADGALTQLITMDVIDANQGDTFNMSIAVKGAFFTASVRPSAANTVYNLTITGATTAFQGQRSQGENVLISVNAGSVAGNSTVNIDATRVWPGAAVLTMYCTAAGMAWNAQLQSIDAITAGVGVEARADDPHQINCQNIFLPAQHVRIQVNNLNAGALFFVLFLVAKPLYP